MVRLSIQRDIMKLKTGDWIRLKPDAEVYLSYKDGSPPAWAIKNEIWVIDGAQELEDDINLNISTLGSVRINPGLYCSWVSINDVKEKIGKPKLSKEDRKRMLRYHGP